MTQLHLGRVLRHTLPAFSLSFFAAGAAGAATLNVNTTNMSIVSDSSCGLREAVQAINTQTATAGCPAGNGVNDVINVPAGTYVATTTLTISRPVEIRGAGVGQTVIRGNLSSGTEVIYARPGPDQYSTVVFQDLTVDKASGQSAPQVSGVYASAFSASNVLSVEFVRTRVAGHTWGGIFVDGASLMVLDSIIENNSSPWSGGGIAVHTVGSAVGTTNIMNSTISNNTSSGDGGGIYHAAQGNSHLQRSTVSKNQSQGSGGGVRLAAVADYFQIDDSTIAFNSAGAAGGGVASTGSGNYYIFNTLVGNNVAHFLQDWDGYATTMMNCLVSDSLGLSINDDAGGNLLDVDPMLDSALLDLGGPYHTKVHRLLPGSPAIDHFSFETTPSGYTDQRYFARGIDGDGLSGDPYDIGAFEYDPNWQTESLLVAAKSSDTHTVTSNSGYSAGKGTNLQSNAVNDYVTYAVPVVQSGTHNVRVRVRRGSNGGRFQLAASNSPSGPWTNIGGTQELYSSSQTFVELNISSTASLTAGTRYFRFLVNGKHSSSTGHQLFLDTIKLTKL